MFFSSLWKAEDAASATSDGSRYEGRNNNGVGALTAKKRLASEKHCLLLGFLYLGCFWKVLSPLGERLFFSVNTSPRHSHRDTQNCIC